MQRVYILDCMDSEGMNFTDGHDDFMATIKRYKPRLVIIDPWHAFLGADVDINRVNAVRPVFQRLANMAKACECGMVLVSHVNKRAQDENANNAATGSTDFINAARSAMRVIFNDLPSAKDERIVVHTKSNYAEAGKSVKYRITTDGEPLLRIDFLIELFTLAKQSDIHTAIDTSGVTYSETNTEHLEKLDRLMEVCDLVMLDIKHIDSKRHKALTGKENESILAFAKYLDKKGVPIWIRHVVIAGYTDSESDLFALGEFIGGLKHLKALDVLPYHTLGKGKYASLGMKYPLEDVPQTSKEVAERAKPTILSGIMAARKKK